MVANVQKIPTAAAKPKEELKVSDINITDEFLIQDENSSGKMISETLLKIPGGGVVLVKKNGSDNEIIGVISVRDVLVSVASGHDVGKAKASEIMSIKMLKVNIEERLMNLINQVQDKQPHAIVVTDETGRFRGYFSPRDFMEALAASR